MSTQAIVIGAGPGGAATAVQLLQRGVKHVVLLDKDKFPREKTCGSALSPNGLKVIEQLGIADEVKRLGYPIHSLRVVTPGNRTMTLSTDQAAIVLRRGFFDNLLVEQAKKLGVTFKENFKATELIHKGGRVVGVKGQGGEELYADYVLCADGAHSIFSWDPRPKRTISTLMGWWEDFPFEPGLMDMVFDKNTIYGWMFPEGANLVNIGICIDGEEEVEENGRRSYRKTTRNVRAVFDKFLQDHYADKLAGARQVGKFKGHPISYTTWIGHCTAPGVVYVGEGARITHNATGEGIYHAMQSGIYAANAVADIILSGVPENQAWRAYVRHCRERFTASFVVGHAIRGVLKTPVLDWLASGYNNATVRSVANRVLGSALAGSELAEDKNGQNPAYNFPAQPAAAPERRQSSASQQELS